MLNISIDADKMKILSHSSLYVTERYIRTIQKNSSGNCITLGATFTTKDNHYFHPYFKKIMQVAY